jgi:lipoate-protein ligase A
MIFQAKQKVKEGKVVKVEIECNELIRNVRITGDFFIHPEDILDEIEKSIISLERSASIETMTSNIKSRIADRDVQMIGISPESIALLIREALK